MRSISLVWAALLVCAGAGPARASGFSVARFASEHGHPTADNPTATYYNPAAIAQSERPRLLLDLNVAYRRFTYDRSPHPSDAPTPSDAPDANAGRAEAHDWLAGPTLALSAPLGDFAFGLMAYAPFGAPVSFEQRESYAGHPRLAGPVDGVSRWHSIEGAFVTGQVSAAVAYRLQGARLSAGLTLTVAHTVLEDVRARADGSNDVEQEGRSLVEASGSAFAGGLGLLWEALPEALWLGISYQSRPNFAGGLTLAGSVENRIGTRSTASVDVHFDLPDVVRWGARFRPERSIELRLFGDYTRWSAFERQCIVNAGKPCELERDGSQPAGGGVLQSLERDFRDTVELRAGMSYFFRSGLEFFSGVGAGSSAVPDATLEPGLPDAAFVTFALGGRAPLTEQLALALSYTHFVFAPRTVASELSGPPLPTRQPDASGTYKQFVGLANVNADFSF